MTTLTDTLQALRARLPESAKDLRLNLQTVLGAESLTPRQRLGTFLASAYSTGSRELLEAARAEAAETLSAEDVATAEKIAATMGMNTVYYRFLHLVEDEEYAKLPARLRMQALGHPPDDRVDRELWALAVAALNGCGQCVQAHEQVLRADGVSRGQIQDVVRIASVVGAVAKALPHAA